jgi:DNA-binding NarL/FixJ family response regulator
MSSILLIDDEPKIIQDILSLFGYDVKVATDGLSGIELFNRHHDSLELVILDIMMPNVDGWAVLKYIRSSENASNIPVIMLTVCGEEKNLISGLKRGADEYLVKPITPAKLLAHIEAVMRRVSWQKQLAAKGGSNDTGTVDPNMVKLLTQREKELLGYIVQGCSNQKIAESLSITETTVKNHLANIFRKLQVSNRTQAAFLAQKMKLV